MGSLELAIEFSTKSKKFSKLKIIVSTWYITHLHKVIILWVINIQFSCQIAQILYSLGFHKILD